MLMLQWNLRWSSAKPSLLLRLEITTVRCTTQMQMHTNMRSQQTRLAASHTENVVFCCFELQVCLTRRPTTPPWVSAYGVFENAGLQAPILNSCFYVQRKSLGFDVLALGYIRRSVMLAQRCSMQHSMSYLSRLCRQFGIRRSF